MLDVTATGTLSAVRASAPSYDGGPDSLALPVARSSVRAGAGR